MTEVQDLLVVHEAGQVRIEGLGSIHFGTKETMLTNLKTYMEEISGIQYVERQKKELYDNLKYPGIFINDIREQRTYVLQNVIKSSWTLTVVAYDYSETEPLWTKLDTLIKAVKQKIGAYPDIGGQAYWCKILSVDTDEGVAWPYCIAIFTLEIMYLAQE